MQFYNNYWPMTKTMMVCETTQLPNPIGFVHFKTQNPQIDFIKSVIREYDKEKGRGL